MAKYLGGRTENRAFWIELLGPRHGRVAFSCGVDSLDLYLQKQAGQNLKKHAAVSLVLTPDGQEIAF